MVVCESVPTTVSGNATHSPFTSSENTTGARYSMSTWCTMPVDGGTTRRRFSDDCPQRRNSKRSALRWNSSAEFFAAASGVPKKSTCTEWSITRSAGRSGLIRLGSPPSSAIASRITARSTTAGTPVRSCSTTRAGRKAISASFLPEGDQRASAAMSSRVTVTPSSWRSRFSSRTRIERGSRASLPSPASSTAARR